MSARLTLRKLREAIGRATISVPGWPSIMFSVGQEEPRQESVLAKVAREGGKWWKDGSRGSDEPEFDQVYTLRNDARVSGPDFGKRLGRNRKGV
jgi:hypothetical protein